ncbi:tetratricopeptide repeat protein [Lederbergia sp. NSJ-179]|uniref:tetratricopeptide repeat protein n=1 Tax=Lederbergia sp. NSJ-179 TaxID=2931402 RepID=UPI001FD3B15C|nr:tetratricopeptide repeat protein [Lederbergia sp. NSJ-179]MCJ7841293.1 tetratricopeptide repeat protein [Lederbergia sp. NSJ-179]
MFGFGKKKNKEPKKVENEEVELTPERKEELLLTISSKKEQINNVSTEEEKAQIFEEIGLAFNELGEEDNAIDSLEKSIQTKKSLGNGYKTLLKLYNKKRAKAAKENDGKAIQLYLMKMDQMMQVSKDVTRGVK